MRRDQAETTTIPLQGAVNARDVGGIPLTGGGVVATGVLLRSDNLQDLTADDVATLVETHGVRTVVDLRTDGERELEGPGPLVRDRRVRIDERSLYPETGGATDLDLQTVKVWGDGAGAGPEHDTPTVRAYLGYLVRRPDSIVEAVRAIAAGEGATLVHCAAGKDRTGVVVALALDAVGAERDAVVADYLATGENIEGIVARLASSPTYSDEITMDDVDRHRPQPGAMDRVLEYVDAEHDGAAAWLSHHGLTDDELTRLRERLAGG